MTGHVLVPFRRHQKAHLATCRDILLADVAEHLAVLDQCRSARSPLGGEDGQTDQGGDAVAAGGDLDQRVLAQFEEGGLAQQVESRRAAQRLLGEDDQIGMQGPGLVDRVDDLRGVAFDVADGVVQLGDGDFHSVQF